MLTKNSVFFDFPALCCYTACIFSNMPCLPFNSRVDIALLRNAIQITILLLLNPQQTNWFTGDCFSVVKNFMVIVLTVTEYDLCRAAHLFCILWQEKTLLENCVVANVILQQNKCIKSKGWLKCQKNCFVSKEFKQNSNQVSYLYIYINIYIYIYIYIYICFFASASFSFSITYDLMPCAQFIILPRITNGTPVNSICLEEFTVLKSSNNILCRYIPTVKIIRRWFKVFLLLKKNSFIYCNWM